MNTIIRAARSARFLLPLFGAILLSRSVEAQPALSVTPTSSATNPITVQTNVGTNAPSQTVQVRNSNRGALKWSVVQPSVNWLSVSPTSGVNNGALTLTFATSNKAVGQYDTSFVVQSTTTGTPGSPATVYVRVNISGTAPPPLTANCPANKTVASPNGSPVAVTYTIPTASGGTSPYTYSGLPSSGSSFPVGTTTVQVTVQDSSQPPKTASCSFTVTVTPPPLTIICPTNMSVASSDGSPVVVTYTLPTPSGGTPTYTVSGLPSSGSSFQVGTTTVQVTAQDSSQPPQTASCSFTVTVTDSSAPPPTGVGPQSTITCPSGAVDILTTDTVQLIQSQINNFPGTTTFCFKVGIHHVDQSIIPKTGNTFIGEYGAILDGTGWTTTDDIDAAFRAYNQDIDNITIRNLVIRNVRRAIQGLGALSDHWTIEYNDIGPNYSGIVFPSNSRVWHNNIHDNYFSGYVGSAAHNALIEGNEIARNGWEQKIAVSDNVWFRNNFVHHNAGAGIWFDTDNTNAVIEGNVVEDSGWIGIFYEISAGGIIRNNTIRRSGDAGVFLSDSKSTEISNNVLENNFRAITYFLNCAAVGGGSSPPSPHSAAGWDLADNLSHDNTITVGTNTDALAAVFSYTSGECTDAYVEPYKNGSKNLKFLNNTWDVTSPTTGQYWFWAGLKTWADWQALGFDPPPGGTVK
jgi:parallel beta-helix repeat protein